MKKVLQPVETSIFNGCFYPSWSGSDRTDPSLLSFSVTHTISYLIISCFPLLARGKVSLKWHHLQRH